MIYGQTKSCQATLRVSFTARVTLSLTTTNNTTILDLEFCLLVSSMTTRHFLDTSPQQSAKRQKSFHDLSTDTDMSDANMSGMQPASSIASTNMDFMHGDLDHDLHGPHSTSAYTPSTSYLGASDPTQPTTQGLNSSLMTGTAPQTNGTSHGPIVALQVKRLSPNAKVPTRGSKFAAGYDMYASETKTVPARGKAMVGTGIAVAVPIGTCK
jgi:hypothetical protein